MERLMAMAKCWETRGCDDEMQSRCPHNVEGMPCPADCLSTHCQRPTHETVDAMDALMNPDVDRAAAVKEACLFCRFFLENGPKIDTDAPRVEPHMAARGLNIIVDDR
jgi:hypothetical protein